MKAKTLFKTCNACPAQWEGHLDDGRMFYIRYRSGLFSARVSDSPTEDVFDAVDGKVIHREPIGGPLDGAMCETDMRAIMENAGFVFELTDSPSFPSGGIVQPQNDQDEWIAPTPPEQ